MVLVLYLKAGLVLKRCANEAKLINLPRDYRSIKCLNFGLFKKCFQLNNSN